jgi:hypothetical protein
VQVVESDPTWPQQPAFVFKEYVADFELGKLDSSRTFYQQTDAGLFMLGYDGAGYIIPAAASSDVSYRFRGITYASLEDLLGRVRKGALRYTKALGDIIVEDPPLLGLKYPIMLDSVWVYRPSEPFHIEKHVTSYEIVSIPSGTYGCFVVQWLHDIDNDEVIDTDIEFYDYVSEVGLVVRDITLYDVEILDPMGNVLEVVDVLDRYELVAAELY